MRPTLPVALAVCLGVATANAQGVVPILTREHELSISIGCARRARSAQQGELSPAVFPDRGDRYHLVERLADALEIAGIDADERKRQLDEWRESFDTQDTTIDIPSSEA